MVALEKVSTPAANAMSPEPHHLDHIKSFIAMEVFARAQELEAQGREIIHLEFGEPDFPAPDVATEALQESLAAHPARYTHTQGTQALREAICRKYARDYGVSIQPEQVLVSTGSSLLLFLAIRTLAPPGSEMLVTAPCYACYENLMHLAGVRPVRVPLRLENGFQLDPEDLRRAMGPNTRGMILNSPMNPTGVTFRPEVLQAIAELGLPVISDEIYADLSYGGRSQSFLEFAPEAIALNGFSKYYAMTGWRLGYLIMPPRLMSVAARTHQSMMISATHFVQDAGVRVLDEAGPQCEEMKTEFNRRRQFLLQTLREIGRDPGYEPDGAFYLMLQIPQPGLSSEEFSLQALEQAGVAMTPGADFGPGGEGFVRFSYANSQERLGRAVRQLVEAKLL
jgi:aspartate/methionine/tyrosine aminotransferase